MNLWPVIAATFIAFVASAVYYIIFAKQRTKVSSAAASSERPPAWQMAAELLRNLILALVLAYIINEMKIEGVNDIASLSIVLWVGFPLILLSGSVIYEKAPIKLAIIHGGDWLLKLFLMIAIIASLN